MLLITDDRQVGRGSAAGQAEMHNTMVWSPLSTILGAVRSCTCSSPSSCDDATKLLLPQKTTGTTMSTEGKNPARAWGSRLSPVQTSAAELLALRPRGQVNVHVILSQRVR